MSAFDWDAYANALRLLGKASQAAQSKRDAIAEAVVRRTAAADARLREAVARHELLEERLAQVEALAGRLSRQVGDGPRQEIVAPVPADVRESLAVLKEFEELLGQASPQPRERSVVGWAVAVALLAAAVIAALVWTIWR